MPSSSREGRDSMRVRLMPRSGELRESLDQGARPVAAPSKAIEVLSSPVGAASSLPSDDEARLVVAASWMPPASTMPPYTAPRPGECRCRRAGRPDGLLDGAGRGERRFEPGVGQVSLEEGPALARA